MSLQEASADRETALIHERRRLEGVSTTTQTLPEPVRHGSRCSFVLQDADRDASVLQRRFGLDRSFPDGSAYQTCRAAWYALDDTEIHQGREYRVLTRDFEHPHPDDDREYAVTIRGSNWKAGVGQGDDYTAYYKFDITLQPLDEDGEIQFSRTPDRSLSLKVCPQYEDLVQKDGSELRIPFGEGSLLKVQTTWAREIPELIKLATVSLGKLLGYELEIEDIADGSAGFNKAEVHHRFSREREGDVVHTIRQSADLLASNEADVQTHGHYEQGRWVETYLQTDSWEKLGFPELNAEISIKVYYPDHPEQLEFPMDQPKVEVALQGKERVYDDERNEFTRRNIPYDRWEEVVAILEEILLPHLDWAGLDADALLADDFSDGPDAPAVAFEKPEGRREWLQRHYESLMPALYRQATSHRTDLVYDILAALRDTPEDAAGLTYQQLVERTGAAYSTVRKHVRRLCEAGADDAPGILERERGAVTLVSWSSRYLEELGQDALDKINPDDTPDDRCERAQERRDRREETDDEPDQDDSAADSSSGRDSDWRYFEDVDLTERQLATALERDHLAGDEVRVRVDSSPIFATGPPG